ncbi:MAG: GNAT family N-acetyltransferase [Eubacteriales bacterium]
MYGQVTQAECIKTKRLELKSYKSGDIAQLTKLLTDAEVTKTFMVPDFKSEKQVLDLAYRLIELSKTEDVKHLEYGIYLNDTLIGFINDCGIDDEEIEIGYVIDPDYKGQGYATEAVSAVIEDLFKMGFKKITAGCFEENTASRRVMEKCGMRQTSKSDKEEYRGVSHICRYFEIVCQKEDIAR